MLGHRSNKEKTGESAQIFLEVLDYSLCGDGSSQYDRVSSRAG